MKAHATIILIGFLLAFAYINGFAQKKVEPKSNITQVDPRIAKMYFDKQQYIKALNEYLSLEKIDSNNIDNKYKIGVCYLYTNINKKRAVDYLEMASKIANSEKNYWYELGLAYALNYRFREAITAFEKYKSMSGGKDTYAISAERRIQMCNNAIALIKSPINITFDNLGPEINTTYPEYNPFIVKDESAIVFSTKRKTFATVNESFDGFPASDVYISNFFQGKWTKARSISQSINSDYDEDAVGMTVEGNEVFIKADMLNGTYKTFSSTSKARAFQTPKPLGNYVDNMNNITGVAVSPYNKILVFSAASKGKGNDLYFSRKLPTGTWGNPTILGSTVNTDYDELYPSFSADGKTLYFSSSGHNSMGGFDIFKATWDDKTESWSNPVNMGYPLNTPDDEFTFSISSNGRHAYMSYFRDDAIGDRDIYLVTFNDVEPAYTVIYGYLYNIDGVSVYDAPISNLIQTDDGFYYSEPQIPTDVKAKITVINKNTNDVVGTYIPNKHNGKFTLVLSPGDYIIKAEATHYNEFQGELKILDVGSELKEQTMKINLRRDL